MKILGRFFVRKFKKATVITAIHNFQWIKRLKLYDFGSGNRRQVWAHFAGVCRFQQYRQFIRGRQLWDVRWSGQSLYGRFDNTAGIAANNPIAVAMSASEIPGATVAKVA